ncbi:MAG: transglycosylase SLT domain-containing protein [Beijerinckiaceae bacterium]
MLRLSVCAAAVLALGGIAQAATEPPHPAALDEAIIRQAHKHGVPEKLVRRIVMRESKYNARAHNRSFWGLMQISYPTAKSMGFKGKPRDLLDPFVNLTYAVPYLANAFIIAGKEEDAAVRLYASGYYQTAKSRGLLSELRTADSEPVSPEPSLLAATAQPISNLAAAVANTPNAIQVASAAAQAPDPAAAQAQNPAGAGPAQAEQSHPGATGGGTDHDPAVMMTLVKGGYSPPKKWTKDGGITVIARGEQRIEQIAASRLDGAGTAGAKDAKSAAKPSKPVKVTAFAMLDPPQAEAPATSLTQVFTGLQAYAAPEPRDNGAPQTAITLAAAPARETSARPAVQLRGPVDAAGTRDAPAAKPAPAKPVLTKTAPAKTDPAKATPVEPVVAEAPAPAPAAPLAETAANTPASPYGNLTGSVAPLPSTGFALTSVETAEAVPVAATPVVAKPASPKPKPAAKTAVQPIQLHVASAEKPAPARKHLALAAKVDLPEAK